MVDGAGARSPSTSWDDWRRAVFGDPFMVWHEGPDFSRLLELARANRADVGISLAVGVAQHDEVAAQSFIALAEAGLVPDGAETLLRAAVPDGQGTFLVRLAEALYALTGDEAWARPIVRVLTTVTARGVETFWGNRLDAAIALSGFPPTEHLVDALARAVTDHEYLVRYHASNTLLRYCGERRDVSDISTFFDKICSGDPASWRAAAEHLASMASR
ncbi:hypothetical protein [Pseudofrankia saprophytica]|uniref:hypothetical protein n=1 Tax=Pseudofrankia saprophytica TaxID=298655 RepID=UPI000234D00A|nr:hypothetical protein [Pseudofrankia saprophytica]